MGLLEREGEWGLVDREREKVEVGVEKNGRRSDATETANDRWPSSSISPRCFRFWIHFQKKAKHHAHHHRVLHLDQGSEKGRWEREGSNSLWRMLMAGRRRQKFDGRTTERQGERESKQKLFTAAAAAACEMWRS